MDPTTVYNELLSKEPEEAYHDAKHLLRWLSRGGFPPRGVTIHAAREKCRDVIRLCHSGEIAGEE
jgi:hypothetical protein